MGDTVRARLTVNANNAGMLRPGFTLSLIVMALTGCSVLPERSRQPVAPAPARGVSAPQTGDAAQCLSELGRLGASFSPLPDRYLAEHCTNLNTVKLVSLASDAAGPFSVTNLGPVTCDVSQAFAGWTRFGVDRAARQILGSGLRTIETFGSYSCRTVAGSSRISAHAQGAAIDVSGFVLEDGRRITIKAGWNGGTEAERRFLRIVHQSACKRFGTVLGPEYNSAHSDHLHLEGVIAGRGYCR
jgi:hypothetical protein